MEADSNWYASATVFLGGVLVIEMRLRDYEQHSTDEPPTIVRDSRRVSGAGSLPATG